MAKAMDKNAKHDKFFHAINTNQTDHSHFTTVKTCHLNY